MDNKKTRRQFLQATGIGIVVSSAGCSAVIDSDTTDETRSNVTSSNQTETTSSSSESKEVINIDQPTGNIHKVPIPENINEYDYPIMGYSNASVRATLYGGWQCPYTQTVVLNLLNEIIKEFILTGDAAIEYRGIVYRDGKPFPGPEGPRTERTSLAIWHHDAESYWSFFEYMFQNQQRVADGSVEELIEVANAAGVSKQIQIKNAIDSNAYQSQLVRTMERARRISITQIPRIVIKDEVTVPSVNPDATKNQLERAADNEMS